MSALLDRSVEERAPAAPAADPAPPPPGRLARAAAALAVLAVAVGLGWSVLVGGGGLPHGVAAVVLSGTVERADGTGWAPVSSGGELPLDARIRAVDGVAALEVDGGELRLAGGTHLTLRADAARLERGSVVTLGDARTVRVDAVTVTGEGTWRVDDGGQPRVAAYEGSATVDDGASTVEVPRLRQVSVRDGVVAGNGVQPLRYLAADPFDATLLAEAFRVDDLATSLLRSLASEHGTDPREPAFYRAFVTVDGGVEARLRDAAAEVEGDRFGPPADVLLTAVIIDAVTTETDREPAAATETVVALRRDGATWGLLALDAGIDGAALSAAADRALERAEADPPPEAPPEPASPTGAATDAATDAEGGVSPAPDPGGGGGTASAPAPPASPAPQEPPTDAAEDADDDGALRPVEDLLGGTGDAVGGVVGGTSDALGDVVGGVDELLSPGGGLLGR